MRTLRLLPLMLLSLLSGCASGPMPEDQRVLEIRSIRPAAPAPAAFRLTTEIHFVVPGGQGIMGDMGYRVLPGTYFLHGVDARGVYYRHEGNGIKRSGDFARGGGLFVPHDANGRWGVWIFPNGGDQVAGLIGPAGYAMAVDRETNVVYQANIPVDLMPGVRREIEPQLNRKATPVAANPPSPAVPEN